MTQPLNTHHKPHTYLEGQKAEPPKKTPYSTVDSALSVLPHLKDSPNSLTGKVKPLDTKPSISNKRSREEEHQTTMGPPKKRMKMTNLHSSNKGNREIEFKATRVNEEQFASALACLQEMAKKNSAVSKGSVKQKDYYLDHPQFKNSDYALYSKEKVSKSFRVRKEDNNHSLCVKVSRKGDVENDHERREYETPIDDPEMSVEMFKQLGFSVEKIIEKTRTSFWYQTYEIALDEVVGLKKSLSQTSSYKQEFSSHIVEVELKAEAEQVSNIPQCLEKMKTLVESVLGITKYEQEQSGMEKYM